MANVLIATLGESPVVISATVAKLLESGVGLDRVQVLYPMGDDRLIGYGYAMLQDALEAVIGKDRVEPVELPFEDPNSHVHSLTFLKIVAGLLDTHQVCGDCVYLALSGGRKNMSALLSVTAQFYPCIQAQLLVFDRHEDDPFKRSFYALEDLLSLSAQEQSHRLRPSPENFDLVKVPFETLADAAELRAVLSRADRDGDLSVRLSPAAEDFYRQIFGAQLPGQMRVRFTQTAFDQISEWFDGGSDRATILKNYLDLMRDPKRTRAHLHGTFRHGARVFHFCKLGRTAERPFIYTTPNAIDGYPTSLVDEVIVCGISIENNGAYSPGAEDWLSKGDFTPVKDMRDLPRRACTLVAPLGESPMVVTQAYELLQRRDGENLKINRVVVPYFCDNGVVRTGAEILREVFKRRKVELDSRCIDLGDLRSEADCDTYLRVLCKLIADLKQSKDDVALLIAGGRKGMSALGLLAAQISGIPYVYHTLIRDPSHERQIVDECSVAKLQSLPSADIEARLFPDNLAEIATIFPIPLIRLMRGD